VCGGRQRGHGRPLNLRYRLPGPNCLAYESRGWVQDLGSLRHLMQPGAVTAIITSPRTFASQDSSTLQAPFLRSCLATTRDLASEPAAEDVPILPGCMEHYVQTRSRQPSPAVPQGWKLWGGVNTIVGPSRASSAGPLPIT